MQKDPRASLLTENDYLGAAFDVKGTVNEKLSDFAKFLFFTRSLDTTLMSKITKKNLRNRKKNRRYVRKSVLGHLEKKNS